MQRSRFAPILWALIGVAGGPAVAAGARDPLGPELAILGLKVEEDTFKSLGARLGAAKVQKNGGDAAGSLDFICYQGPDGTALFFTSSEGGGGQVNGVQLAGSLSQADLSGDGFRPSASLTPLCAPLPSLSRITASPGGLHLGMSPSEVEAILGRPRTTKAGIRRWNSEHPIHFRDHPDEFTRSRWFEARFVDDRLVLLSGGQTTVS